MGTSSANTYYLPDATAFGEYVCTYVCKKNKVRETLLGRVFLSLFPLYVFLFSSSCDGLGGEKGDIVILLIWSGRYNHSVNIS